MENLKVNILKQTLEHLKVTVQVLMSSYFTWRKHLQRKTTTLHKILSYHIYFDNQKYQQQCITSQEHTEHNYAIQTQVRHIDINQEYADDISKITSNYNAIQHLKQHLPATLSKRDLIINESKTEEYKITRKDKCGHEWQSCKFLGIPSFL